MTGLAMGSWAFGNQDPAPEGLRGILPATVPTRLGSDVLAELGPNWTAWSEATTTAVDKFFLLEGDVAAQKAALDGLKARLAIVDKSLADARYRSIYAPLSTLRGSLTRTIEFADAILVSLALDPVKVREETIAAKKTESVKAFDALKASLAKVPGGTAWLPFIRGEELGKSLSGDDQGAATAAAKASIDRLASVAKIENEAQKAFLSRPEFKALQTSLEGYVAAVGAPVDDNAKEKIRASIAQLATAVQQAEENPSTQTATALRSAVKNVKEIVPGGGAALVAVVQKNFLNYNLRLVASETFLSKLMSDARTEAGGVRDFILGANVGGYQTTSTNVGVNLKPSPNSARFDITLNGVVQSTTTGVTSEATVNTSGYHTFYATKDVNFDGEKFFTAPALIGVRPNNTTTGISTRYSGSFLFGGMADRIAAGEVASRRPQAEAIAAQRVRERVLPRFNEEVDTAMSNAGVKLEKELFAGLKKVGLFPDSKTYQTTETDLRLSSRLMEAGEIGGNVPPANFLTATTGATILLHESLLNNSIDRMGFAGKTFTEEEFRKEIEKFLSTALGRPITLKPKPKAEGEAPNANSFVFAKEDPVRIRASSGVLTLVLRTGFKSADREEIPVSEITVPLNFQVSGPSINVTRGTIAVADVEGDLGIATKGVIRKKIQDALPDRTVESKFQIEGPKKSVSAFVTKIAVVDGWVIVDVQ
jgi:hypothetical protein